MEASGVSSASAYNWGDTNSDDFFTSLVQDSTKVSEYDIKSMIVDACVCVLDSKKTKKNLIVQYACCQVSLLMSNGQFYEPTPITKVVLLYWVIL